MRPGEATAIDEGHADRWYLQDPQRPREAEAFTCAAARRLDLEAVSDQ